jgi:hypothetical protein
LGPNPEPTVLWMQCMGVDAVYVADKRSQEEYKDFQHPTKLAGVLPVLFDDQQGNTLYRVPRRYAARARVVETQRLNALKPPRFNDDVEYLRAYADVIERGPASPATLKREGTDAMRVHAKLEPGQSVLVQESYDPAWHAWSQRRPLVVRKDALGMIAIDAPPGEQDISLVFLTPLENRVGRVVTALTVLVILALMVLSIRRERRA